MTKRSFLRLSLIALLGTVGFVAFLLTRPGSPINRWNFDKIQVGMTLAEVEAIIGLPPGDFATKDLRVVDFELPDKDVCAVERPKLCDELIVQPVSVQ